MVDWRTRAVPAIAVVVPAIAGIAWSGGGSPEQSATSALAQVGYPNFVATHCEKIGVHTWNCLVRSRKTGLLAAVRFHDHVAGPTHTFSVAERRVGQLPAP